MIMVELDHTRRQIGPAAMRVQSRQGDVKSMPGVLELGGGREHDTQQRCSRAPWFSWDASPAWHTRWAPPGAPQNVRASSHFTCWSCFNAFYFPSYGLQASKSLFQALGEKLEAALTGDARPPAVRKSPSISITQNGANGHLHQQNELTEAGRPSGLECLTLHGRIVMLRSRLGALYTLQEVLFQVLDEVLQRPQARVHAWLCPPCS